MKLFMLNLLVSIMHFTCATFDLGTCSLQCGGQAMDDGSDLLNQFRGPSGKRGPVGPIGLPGPKGDAGEPCDYFNESEMKITVKLGRDFIKIIVIKMVVKKQNQLQATSVLLKKVQITT